MLFFVSQMSRALSNRLTLTGNLPTPPKDFVRLEFLYRLLWEKEDSLHDVIFHNFEHPLFNTETDTDTNPQEKRGMGIARILSLSGISSRAQPPAKGWLPCGVNQLLVRGAYREMYDILVQAQKDRLKYIRDGKLIPHWRKISLILGQRGIGVTWFLSYVLVRRLLEGKPTIFQATGDAVDFISATHYLIDGNGVHRMESFAPSELRKDPEIWALADQKPVGPPRRAIGHSWLVVVTSSPREENYRHLDKEFSPEKYYLPAWDWEEVVAAA
jgi:hypothetical protein